MITSRANERIKFIRSLRERKSRRESGLFFVEGLRLVGEALEARADVQQVIFCEALLESAYGRERVAAADRAGIELVEVSPEIFQAISAKDGPQGLAAVLRQAWTPLERVSVESGRPWVALDSVADPGNLGTILRTCDASGGAGILLLDQSTDPYDPNAVRASMGAVFDQRICRANLADFAEWKRACGCALVGTSDAASQDYHAYAYPDAFVLAMGSERQGLQAELLALCEAVVSIPMLGKSDSLNLAVATAVVLYEALNQRRDRVR